MATTIHADGSGEVREEIIYSAEETAAFAQSPNNAGQTLCESLNTNLPPGVTVTFDEEKRGEETHCVSSRPFSTLNDLRLMYELRDGVTVNELALRLGRLTFDVSATLPATTPNGQPPLATEWHLRMPGMLGEHDAQRVEDGVLIWTLTPGETTTMHAESSVGLLNAADILILSAAGLSLLLLIAGGLFFRQRVSPRSATA